MKWRFRILKGIAKGFSIVMNEWQWTIFHRDSVRDSHSWKWMAICTIFSLWVQSVVRFFWELLIRSISIMIPFLSFVRENFLHLWLSEGHILYFFMKIAYEKFDIIPILRMDRFFRQVTRIMNSISTIHLPGWVFIVAHDIHLRIE